MRSLNTLEKTSEKRWGKLYGVGVGPGATDLMTLRAVRVLNSVPVLAIPKSSDYVRPFAWRISSPVIEERSDQEKLFLIFPMSKDPAIVVPAWDRAFTEIGKRLEKGLDVAFITQGDPSVYSSWSYLLEESPTRWPGIEIEIVPAVSSITAIPAALQTPLADGQERFCVVPATYGMEDLPKLLAEFDTIVLTKVGRMIPALVEILREHRLLDAATYVAYGTTDEQKVVRDLETLAGDKCDYFSMVVISIRRRRGVLRGTCSGG
jgi:precorrin-2/cobalt-factor-2 C20-methyltransferase